MDKLDRKWKKIEGALTNNDLIGCWGNLLKDSLQNSGDCLKETLVLFKDSLPMEIDVVVANLLGDPGDFVNIIWACSETGTAELAGLVVRDYNSLPKINGEGILSCGN